MRHVLRFATLACLTACSAAKNPQTASGIAEAVIAQVPPQVNCVRLIVTAAQSVNHDFDVTPGQSAVLRLDNLPVGNLTVTAFAFANACASAGGTQASWGSSPALASIAPGQVTQLSLTLEPVGGAIVGINFDGDGGAPLDLGAPADLSMPVDLSAPRDLATTDLGISAVLTPSVTSLDFGTLLPGSSASQSFILTNTGGSPSGPVRLSVTDAGFTASLGCRPVIEPGAQCPVTVTFTALSPGTHSDSLVITSASGSITSVALIGRD
jgi:hypothetical protein